MLTSPRPLEEKLTLFWHGHFATAVSKVRDYRMMLRQNAMLRERASGRLRDLLVGILKDPAMLVFLDNGENVKEHPNENFGRELLELFTMGVGNYTERDVREAARAFTGWTNDVLEFKFDAKQHDFGEKTFLGQNGTLQRRGHHRHHSEAAGHRRVRRGEDLPLFRARRDLRRRTHRTGPLVPRQRLPDEAAPEADLPLEGLLQPAVVRDADQEPGAPGDFHLQEDGPERGADDSRLRADDGRAGTVAVQSAERRRLGRRAHLDYARNAAAARQHVPRRPVPRRRRLPSARSLDAGHLRARRTSGSRRAWTSPRRRRKATPSRT